MNPHILVCDIETTDKVISNAQVLTGCLILLDESLREIDRKTFKMRHRYWDKFAEQAVAIHGITREMAEGFQHRANVVPGLLDWIPRVPEGLWFCCHANRKAGTFGVFDRQIMHMMFLDSFLAREGGDHFTFDQKCPASKVISTHTLSKKILGLEKNNLKAVADHFRIPLKHHDSESDAEVCAEILRRFATMGDIYGISMEEYDGIGVDKREAKTQVTKPRKARGVDWYE